MLPKIPKLPSGESLGTLLCKGQRGVNDAYREGHERTFGKQIPWYKRRDLNKKAGEQLNEALTGDRTPKTRKVKVYHPVERTIMEPEIPVGTGIGEDAPVLKTQPLRPQTATEAEANACKGCLEVCKGREGGCS